METQSDDIYPDENVDGNDILVQLRQLAILYHARGRTKEAQEIYRMMLVISDRRFERDSQGASNAE